MLAADAIKGAAIMRSPQAQNAAACQHLIGFETLVQLEQSLPRKCPGSGLSGRDPGSAPRDRISLVDDSRMNCVD